MKFFDRIRYHFSTDGRLIAIEQKLAVLEKDAQKNAKTAEASEHKLLGVLQTIIDGLKTLDSKTASYRNADFLARLSATYPKKRTVIFMGRSYFGDNIKYAYLAFVEKAASENIACYFLPHDERQYKQLCDNGLPCLPVNCTDNVAYIEILLSTAILILDEQFMAPNWRQSAQYALLRGAKTVQLWHGIPLKQIGIEALKQSQFDASAMAELLASCGPFDVFVASSSASRADWQQKFTFHHFAPIGYPRDDVLLRDTTPRDTINVDAQELAALTARHNKKSILYAPTFRDQNGIKWFESAKIHALADECAKNDLMLYVNLHPGEQSAVGQFRQLWPSICFIEPQTDIYPILKNIDIFITDYSSLAFDFLLLDRPIIFYRPDHADYITRSRHLIADHDQYICGPVAFDIDGLIGNVHSTVQIDIHRDARASLTQKLYDYKDGKAGQRLCDTIIDMLKDIP